MGLASREEQLELLRKQTKSYGGELLKTRRGRQGGRPLATRATMHLVLRSSKAVGDWSFRRKHNSKRILEIVSRFSKKYGVRVLSLANVGNHLHFHIKLGNRFAYQPFIRAITGSIAMAVTGASRWNKLKAKASDRFWDYRPFTRVVYGLRSFLNLKDYLLVNQLEGAGYDRISAKFILAAEQDVGPPDETPIVPLRK